MNASINASYPREFCAVHALCRESRAHSSDGICHALENDAEPLTQAMRHGARSIRLGGAMKCLLAAACSCFRRREIAEFERKSSS